MSKLCALDQMQILVRCADNFKPCEIQEVVECFSFESMININILNNELLRLHIVFMEKLISHDVFYKNSKPLKHTLMFILSNLQIFKDGHLPDILGWLLHLLKGLIHKGKTFQHLKELLQMKREKIFDSLVLILKLETFNLSHVGDFTSILCDIFIIDGFLSESHLKNLADIINAFRKLDVIYEVTVISQIVIEKYLIVSAAFSICSIWLLTEGVEILLKISEERTILKLLQILNYFYKKFDVSKNIELKKHVECSIQIMSKNSEVIISFLTKESLRKDSIILFSTILCKLPLANDWDFSHKKLLHLPADPSEWVNSEPTTFLRICYLLCSNNKIMWAPAKILNSIKSLVYSYQRFVIKPSLLKIICYVYPFVIPDCVNDEYVILGDDLLILLTKRYYELDDIFSPHISQLYWILRRGETSLKKALILFWLKSDSDLEVLKKCIKHCKVQNILIAIVMDSCLDEFVGVKAAEFVKSLDHSTLNIQIAKMLPFAFKSPKIFKRLMISDPGIPEDKEISKQLCEFMSLQLTFVVEEFTFGLACDYSKKLVTYLKTDVDVVNVFCRNYKNILYILRRLKKLNDETAVKTMGLLKVLLLVQKRNHTSVNTPIETDITYTLIGSTSKLEKGLDIIHLLTSQDLLIRLSQDSIYKVFVKLFSFCQDPVLAGRSYICLTQILKFNNWLATTSTVNVFVETNCSLAVDKKSWCEFVAFLATWVKILKQRMPGEMQFYFAHTGIIRNYIKRLPSLTRKKVSYLLNMLNQLEALKRTFYKSYLTKIPLEFH